LPQHFDGVIDVALVHDIHRRHQQHEHSQTDYTEHEVTKETPAPKDEFQNGSSVVGR
jgi:hypothetical protein